MAISLEDDLLTLTDAAKVLPPLGGRRIHPSTLWRWCRRGCRGIKLDYVRLGHRMCVSRDALDQFSRQLAEQDEHLKRGAPPVISHTAKGRRGKLRERQIANAKKRLAAAGIG